MHDKPTGAGDDERATNAALDLHDQGVALVHVLTLHPAPLRLPEMVHEVTAGSAEFRDGDRFARAVRDLIGVGLLFESAELVLPTRAAIRFSEIQGVGI